MTLKIKGLECPMCSARLERVISKLPGVSSAKADHEAATLVVEGAVDAAAVREAVLDAGFEVV